MIPSSFVGQSVQVEFVNNTSGVMRVWPYYIVTDYSPISVVLTAEYWEDGRRTTGETIVCRRDEIKSIALKDWGKRKHKSWSDYVDSTHFPTYTPDWIYGNYPKYRAESWYGKEVKGSWDAAEDQGDEMERHLSRLNEMLYVIDEAPPISKDLVDKIEELYRNILTEPERYYRPEQPWSTSQYVEEWEKYMVENYPHLCPERLIAKWSNP